MGNQGDQAQVTTDTPFAPGVASEIPQTLKLRVQHPFRLRPAPGGSVNRRAVRPFQHGLLQGSQWHSE